MNFKLYMTCEMIPPFYKNAISEYEKRLTRYCKIQYENYKTVAQYENAIASLQDKVKIFKIAVLIGESESSEISSEDLAKTINQWGVHGISDIALILCPPDNPLVPIAYDFKLSFSAMTLSKGLLATLVYEQIYRAYRILNNQPYHK